MMVRAGLAVIFLLAQAGAVAAQNGPARTVMARMPRVAKCLEILELERVKVTNGGETLQGDGQLVMHYAGVMLWLDGYITGRNVYDDHLRTLEGTLTQGISSDDLMKWVFSYCRANPTKDIADAAMELTETLRKAKP